MTIWTDLMFIIFHISTEGKPRVYRDYFDWLYVSMVFVFCLFVFNDSEHLSVYDKDIPVQLKDSISFVYMDSKQFQICCL